MVGDSTDEELLERISRKDTQAFIEIRERYLSMVKGIAFYYLHRMEDAEEASQDVFLNLWNKAHTINALTLKIVCCEVKHYVVYFRVQQRVIPIGLYGFPLMSMARIRTIILRMIAPNATIGVLPCAIRR